MIKHPLTDEKITPNQLAKWVIIDAMDAAACAPQVDGMTEREQREFSTALNKQIERVEKFLNL